MSESALPDDVKQWPSNPFELLGVKRGVNEKELKRAYQRLLRAYRPDRNPEAFRLIRDAYETVRSWGTYVTYETDEANASEEQSNDAPTSESESVAPVNAADSTNAPSESEQTNSSLAPRLQAPTFDVRLKEAAVAAREDRTIEAYAAFSRLAEEHPTRHEPYLACYWLSRLEPSLDDVRSPIEWLHSAVRQCSNPSPAVETYLTALERMPALAMEPNFAALALSLADGGDVVRCFEVRWRSAAQLTEWPVLLDDLANIRKSPWWLRRDVWLSFMQTALESVSFAVEPPARSIAEWCRNEIDGYENIHASQFDALARLDELGEVSAGVRDIQWRRQLACLRRILSLPSAADGSEAYLDLTRFIDECEQSPLLVLQRISSLNEKTPSLVPRLEMFLHQLSWSLGRYDESDWQWEDLRYSLGEFFSNSLPSYSATRSKLLEYCLARHASPHDVARALAEDKRSDPRFFENLSVLLSNDRALHCAYLAMRIYES